MHRADDGGGVSTLTAPGPARGNTGERIPLVRLGGADSLALGKQIAAVRRVAASGAFTCGPELEAFEREFATYCETAHAVGVSSGTEALALALRALRVSPGDEVIVPANSFIATAEAVSLAGATPALVDVDPVSGLLTAELVAAAITARTRAVIPVHLYGATVELAPILDVARAAGVAVVEDCAQAHGARYRGRRVGGVGRLGCFSFYPTKNLGGWGDGGAVVTDDEQLAARVRMLRSHGEAGHGDHRFPGTTARLDELQAAVLRLKLRELDAYNEDRRQLAAALRAGLRGTAVEPGHVPAAPGGDHVHHLLVVRCERRDELRDHLDARGIASAVHYPLPIHRTPAYAHLGLGEGSLPVCERLSERICTLPLYPRMTAPEVGRIVEAVAAFGGRRRAPASAHHSEEARWKRTSC